MKKYIHMLRAFLKGDFILEQKMQALDTERSIKIPSFNNYIRISTLELAAREITENKVAGAVAELGVYQGDFAKYINAVFPDRTFYLMDTFEGFNEKDVQVEKGRQFSSGEQDFSNTSVELVLSKMPHKGKCIIKKGWFPESLEGLEAQFCFVSIDTDLYKPVYDGLVYFYPRLSKGGYIFVHDYNNRHYAGAKEAVRRYCGEIGIGYVPMSDGWGSVVIVK